MGRFGLQFGLYLVVGGLAFVVDIAAFVGLVALGFAVLLASALSFVIATLANYVLSYTLAFARGRFGRTHELTRLFAVALVGLVLNTAGVWLLLEQTALTPVAAKVAVVPFVLVWNYLGRRLFVFHDELPEGVRSRVAALRQTEAQSPEGPRTLL